MTESRLYACLTKNGLVALKLSRIGPKTVVAHASERCHASGTFYRYVGFDTDR